MADNRINQSSDEQRNSTPDQDAQQANVSNPSSEDQNPQQGSQWNNYRTREMGGEAEGSESSDDRSAAPPRSKE